jgi:EAL domain-containing protein (putative c-di-GMP-specific phosphodiesterase class I)
MPRCPSGCGWKANCAAPSTTAQLAVVYQPLFELGQARPAGGVLSGFEALVRWPHPQDGTLVPAAFLPMAEESQPDGAADRLRAALRLPAAAPVAAATPSLADLGISVNVSGARPGAARRFVARVSRALVESGLQPAQLTLELTENILMSRSTAPAARWPRCASWACTWRWTTSAPAIRRSATWRSCPSTA